MTRRRPKHAPSAADVGAAVRRAFAVHATVDSASFAALQERVQGLVDEFRDYRGEDREWKSQFVKSMFGAEGTGGLAGRVTHLETRSNRLAGAMALVAGLGAVIWGLVPLLFKSLSGK